MRLIDADALIGSMGLADAVKWGNKDGFQLCHSYNSLMLYEIKDDIDAQPTIDAVPVTRCRDCTRHKVEMIGEIEVWRCPLRDLDVAADYYCADGVRNNA